MSWWNRPAPIEPSAVERGRVAVVECSACHAAMPCDATELLVVDGLNLVLCDNPTGCRTRAQAAGIYGRVA